jgi:P27 family predicted phage terminase small subunit
MGSAMTSRLDPPAHYDDERRSIWAETVTRLTTGGRIFRADPEVLNTYVEAVRAHRQASRLLAETNVMIIRDGKATENPALSIQRRSAEAMTRASKALGLDRVPAGDESSMTVPDPGPIHDGKCGGKKKQGEGTCGRPAGWGTPHPGTGRCKLHGGCAPSSRVAALNAQAEQLMWRYDAPPVTNPLEALTRLAGRAAAWEEEIGRRVNELRSLRYEGIGGEQLRAEIAVMERAMDRLGRLLVDIAKLNIEERLAGVRKQTADMLERALDKALTASGLDLHGQAAAREEFRRNLKVVA